MNQKELKTGTLFESARSLLFFGTKESSMDRLKVDFSHLKFARLQQNHGNILVHSAMNSVESTALPVGDAQWTQDRDLALCINTADCIPLLAVDEQSGFIVSIHAGWRGVANRIVPKTFEILRTRGLSSKNLNFFIGPHIRQSSFEVGPDVQSKLLHSALGGSNSDLSLEKNGKYLVDLEKLLIRQLGEFEVSGEQIVSLNRDTMTDRSYHSFRRDHSQAGRQISFIALKGRK